MLVEFIGCTGSGKTTLIQAVQTSLAKTTQVTIASDIVTGLIGLQRIKNPTLQNFILEMVGFPYFVRSFPHYKPFLAYTTQMLSRNASLSISSINNLRSLERKIGVYEITQRFQQDRIILVDEGPVLTAHMFAFGGAPLSARDIESFASLLPLPDLLVYVKAPIEVLVQRTLKRVDPPRELSTKNRAQTEQAVRDTVFIFDEIAKVENICSRLLIVENSDLYRKNAAVDCITGFIRNYQAVKS